MSSARAASRALVGALLGLALCSAGCATAFQVASEAPVALGGTRVWAEILSGSEGLCLWPFFWDIPCSLAADLLLLPGTIPAELLREGARPLLL